MYFVASSFITHPFKTALLLSLNHNSEENGNQTDEEEGRGIFPFFVCLLLSRVQKPFFLFPIPNHTAYLHRGSHGENSFSKLCVEGGISQAACMSDEKASMKRTSLSLLPSTFFCRFQEEPSLSTANFS